ncbi:MAG: hypothetical protein IPO92_18015 [Saprospiraceae bacterium]|nr:hypothetical protein [Saprospiraceae bacterium]
MAMLFIVSLWVRNHKFSLSKFYTDFEVDSTYFIRVYSKNNNRIQFDVGISAYPIAPNDNCNTAALIENIMPICNVPYEGNLAAASPSNLNSGSCNGSPFCDLWYKFVVTDKVHSGCTFLAVI